MVSLSNVQNTSNPQKERLAVNKSPFAVLPEELILKIFENVERSELVNLPSVCHLFRRISYDSVILKEEEAAFHQVIHKLVKYREDKDEVLAQVEEVNQENRFIGVHLEKLARIVKQQLNGLSFRELAQLSFKEDELSRYKRGEDFLYRTMQESWREVVTKQTVVQECLSLNFPFEDYSFKMFLEELARGPKVTTIVIDTEICSNQLIKIASYIANNELNPSRIVIEGLEQMTTEKLNVVFAVVGENNTVEEFAIKGCNLQDEELLSLAQALINNESLRKLELDSFDLSVLGLESLVGLFQRENQLSELKLVGCSDMEIRHLFLRINETNIRKITLPHSNIYHDTAVYISEYLDKCKHLQEVDISQNRLNTETIEVITEAARRKKIEVHTPFRPEY